MPSNDFGRNLKLVRARRGLSRTRLATLAGGDKSQVGRWEESGQRPRPEQLAKLCAVLKVDTLDLPAAEFERRYGFSDVEDHPFIEKLPLYNDQFRTRILELARQAPFVHYTSLCQAISHTGRHRPIELADTEFSERILRSEVVFQRVQIFFERDDLLNAMMDAWRFRGKQYYCRYFPTPPLSIPAINMSSYGNERYIVGGYYDIRSSDSDEYALLLDNRQPLAKFFEEYWRVLWAQSKPFPNPETWSNSKQLCQELGVDKAEWGRLVRAAKVE
jgi:transcriptional regulator with XRE-family HTH domain